MTFREAPELPRFVQPLMPFGRRTFLPDRGPDHGQPMHFVDDGPREGDVVWLQHGNPSWSFLWRKVIEDLRTSGLRTVAPDLFGLGMSAKHWSADAHQLGRHLDALAQLFEALKLERVVLVGQDWGGPLVCGLGARFPAAVRGLVLVNTAVLVPSRPRGTAFHRFSHLPVISDLVFRGAGFPQNALFLTQGELRSMTGEVARAYRWPLRKWTERGAPLGMARMVPDHAEHPSLPVLREGEAWAKAFDGPVELVWGTRDPILGRALGRHERAFPRAGVTRTDGGHFLPEQEPAAIAAAVRRVLQATETANSPA
jgi:haloalkane dehalogenase